MKKKVGVFTYPCTNIVPLPIERGVRPQCSKVKILAYGWRTVAKHYDPFERMEEDEIMSIRSYLGITLKVRVLSSVSIYFEDVDREGWNVVDRPSLWVESTEPSDLLCLGVEGLGDPRSCEQDDEVRGEEGPWLLEVFVVDQAPPGHVVSDYPLECEKPHVVCCWGGGGGGLVLEPTLKDVMNLTTLVLCGETNAIRVVFGEGEEDKL